MTKTLNYVVISLNKTTNSFMVKNENSELKKNNLQFSRLMIPTIYSAMQC